MFTCVHQMHTCEHVQIKISLYFVLLPFGGAEVQPVGKVSNLRVVETLGSTVRLGWTGVAGATQYRIIILNTEGQESGSSDRFFVLCNTK